tara:strand:- start:126 stop:608 length:483 start_codon:yes stop_codon:yes gene_type:complete
MEKTDKSSGATEALEALERELASASGDLTKELSLLTSVIDQRREEERKEQESQVPETRNESQESEPSQADLEEKSREAQPEPTPDEASSPPTPTEGRNFAGWPEKDQRVHHPQQREHSHPSRFFSGLQALFFFSLLGPGLIFIYLMVAVFTVDPFPFRIN